MTQNENYAGGRDEPCPPRGIIFPSNETSEKITVITILKVFNSSVILSLAIKNAFLLPIWKLWVCLVSAPPLHYLHTCDTDINELQNLSVASCSQQSY